MPEVVDIYVENGGKKYQMVWEDKPPSKIDPAEPSLVEVK